MDTSVSRATLYASLAVTTRKARLDLRVRDPQVSMINASSTLKILGHALRRRALRSVKSGKPSDRLDDQRIEHVLYIEFVSMINASSTFVPSSTEFEAETSTRLDDQRIEHVQRNRMGNRAAQICRRSADRGLDDQRIEHVQSHGA